MSANNHHKRFYKPVCYIDKPGKPIKCLSELFMLFELPDIRRDITLWQQLAICSEGHVYDEAGSREDLLQYSNQLILLCEALYVIYTRTAQAKKEEQKLKLSKALRKKIAKRKRPLLLTAQQMQDPYSVINDFCSQFSSNYACTELSDMVDAAVSYRGERKWYRGNIILLYRCLQSIIALTYTLHKTKKRL